MENQALKFIDEQKRNRYARILVFACFFMYVMMMGSKNAYTAEVVAIQDVFGKNKTEVSLAMTFYFVTYAIMQVILASFMGRLNLKIYLTVTVLTSSILTVLIAYSPTLELIYLICAVNGALQAGVYSGCMAVLSKYLPKSMLPFANTMITLGSAVAGGISYGVPALCVSLGRWDMPFIVLGIIFFVSGVIFFYACSVMSKFPPLLAENNSDSRESKVEKEEPFMKLHGKKALIFYFVIMLSITLLSNTIYYSVMNWVPNMLYEVFAMPQSISILLTISLPCTSVVGGIVAINYCEKVKNIINVSIVMHLIATIIAIPFAIIYDVNIVLSIVLLIIFNCISAGVRGVFGGVMAFKMRTQINAGSYAAISNAVAALAAGFIPPLAGSIIDSSLGYQGLYWIVAVVCVVLFAVLIGLNASYKKKYKDKTSQANNGCC